MAKQTGYHFTFVSNVNCEKGECRIFETLEAYRKKGNLLTKERRRILKVLAGRVDRPLKVKAVNVSKQTEVDCGSLCLATPLLKWPIGKNCNLKTGILHIGRDP